jgi:hypothetical protein
MAVAPPIGIPPIVRPPLPPPVPPAKAPPALITGGVTPAQTPLTPEEEARFERDFERMVKIFALERSLIDFIMEDKEHYKVACECAKAALGNLPFMGILASGPGVFGMQLIRAVTVLNPGIAQGATPVTTWIRNVPSTGWMDLFGSRANPVSLAQTGSGPTSATNLKDRVVLAFGGLLELSDSPKIGEVWVQLENVSYPIHNISWLPASNFYYAPLHGVYYVGKNGKFFMRGNAYATGTLALQLVGVCFATGDYLTLET